MGEHRAWRHCLVSRNSPPAFSKSSEDGRLRHYVKSGVQSDKGLAALGKHARVAREPYLPS